MSCYLVDAGGRSVIVRDGFVIGRVGGCDLVVGDSKASRRHARILVAGGVAEIEDLNSSNGTLLNGKPVQRRMLRDGDRIQIGTTELVFREGVPTGQQGAVSPVVPGAPAAPAAPAGAWHDDDELFGDDPELAAAAPPPAPPPARLSAPPPERPSPPPPATVVEFADEVVEVRSTERTERALARPGGDPRARGPAAEDVVETQRRVLQFARVADRRGGLLGDDLAQIGGGLRTLLVLAAVALGCLSAWVVVSLVR